jgi:hypothetical protein
VAGLGVPALFAVWANAHGSIIPGLGWLGAVTTGRSVEWWKGRREADGPAVGRLLVAVVLSVAAACANPDGPRLLAEAFTSIKNPNLWALDPWQPVDFSKPAGMPWVYFATLVTLFLAQLAVSRPYTPTALVVILSFGFWPLVQQRGLAFWWLIVPWLLVPQAAALAERLSRRDAGPAAEAGPELDDAGRRWWTRGILVAFALALLVSPASRWFLFGRPRPLERIASGDTPVRLALELTAEADGTHLPELRQTLRANYPAGRFRGAILGGEGQGDFLAWVLDGDNDRPVMTYTRPEALGEAHWAECRRALDGLTDWWEILARHQVNLVAIDPRQHGKFADRLRLADEWQVLQDDGLLVAVRREPKLPSDLMGP